MKAILLGATGMVGQGVLRAYLRVRRGADSTKRGRMIWARVKGQTENALLQMPFKAVYVFRPGYVHPSEFRRVGASRIQYRAGSVAVRISKQRLG